MFTGIADGASLMPGRLAGTWRRWLRETSHLVARSRGRQEPSQQDQETAFGLLAVSIFGRVSAAATTSQEIEPIIQRLSERLLDTADD